MIVDSSQTPNDFQGVLKHWRNFRKMSQLDLALAADVSQRHVSWLETGRSQPSREMVLRLSEAMEVPLRDRNQILNSAGFAGMFSEKGLDEPSMTPVMNVLNDMLEHHEPFPAMVLDRMWNVKMKNNAADILFEVTGDPNELWEAVGDNGEHNIALLTLHPKGLRQFISNWDTVGGAFARRLKREAMDSGDADVIAKFEELEQFIDDFEEEAAPPSLLPILPLEFAFGDFKLSLFSVISTFGTAQDITTDELRIETFYPTDEQTTKYFTE
ncbi:MAG: helix-turn-helix transcriptional regulator [Pseudomonadota bacterium]